MTTDTVETRIEAQIAQFCDAVNRHDAAAAAAVYSLGAVVHDPQYSDPLQGREAIERDLAEFFRAFPDLRMELKQSLVVRDRYAMEYRLTGTHKGPMTGPSGTIPATNRRVDVGGSALARVDGEGRVSEEQRHYDLARMLMQLGLLR